MLGVPPELLTPDVAAAALDTEISKSSRLIRAPGLMNVSDEDPRRLRYIFQQVGLDFSSIIVAIDPPYFGYTSPSSLAFTWANNTIPATPLEGWNAVNFADTLIFSNGYDATYAHDFTGAATLVDLSADIIAKTFTIAFGRLFAGAVTVSGVFQGLGVQWNGASALYNDWGGLGSGAQLLISDQSIADRIVAMRALGFDAIGILCRHSLWAGYPTGNALEPAEFRPRFSGVGCVSEATVAPTPDGLTFLSDDGVVSYDINGWKPISGDINAELLPLDYAQLPRYRAAYQPTLRRYVLCTPSCTWVYEFESADRPARWFKRGLIADAVLMVSPPAIELAWDDMVGDWESNEALWDEAFVPGSIAQQEMFFTRAGKFEVESALSTQYFGVEQSPSWRTGEFLKDANLEQLTTLRFEIGYASLAESTIRLVTADKYGNFTKSHTKVLPNTSGVPARGRVWHTTTGLGGAVQVEIVSGSPEILWIRQVGQASGPAVGSL